MCHCDVLGSTGLAARRILWDHVTQSSALEVWGLCATRGVGVNGKAGLECVHVLLVVEYTTWALKVKRCVYEWRRQQPLFEFQSCKSHLLLHARHGCAKVAISPLSCTGHHSCLCATGGP